jgi:hypothetical protein
MSIAVLVASQATNALSKLKTGVRTRSRCRETSEDRSIF